MNKSQLLDAVAEETGFQKAQVRDVMESIFEHTAAALRRGEDVAINGFGSYKVVHRSQRQTRNPRTGERITIAARKAVKFQTAKALADGINQR